MWVRYPWLNGELSAEAMMKVLAAFCASALGMALLAPAVAMAQVAPPPPFTVLPPPPINSPGAKPAAPVSTLSPPTGKRSQPLSLSLPPAYSPAPSQSAPASASTAIPIPALPGMHEGAPEDVRGTAPPTVKVTKHNGKTIEEYYEGGQLYMVQVHPKHGVTYTYFVNKAHKLSRSPGAPPVNPVLYTILTWGGSGSSD